MLEPGKIINSVIQRHVVDMHASWTILEQTEFSVDRNFLYAALSPIVASGPSPAGPGDIIFQNPGGGGCHKGSVNVPVGTSMRMHFLSRISLLFSFHLIHFSLFTFPVSPT